jgi:hypothetical protein
LFPLHPMVSTVHLTRLGTMLHPRTATMDTVTTDHDTMIAIREESIITVEVMDSTGREIYLD